MGEFDILVREVLGVEDAKALQFLSEKDKADAWKILTSLQNQGDFTPLTEFWRLDYETPPPTPQQFLEDDQYLRAVGNDLYPKWKETFIQAMTPTNGIHEMILRGCIGSGKSFFGSVVMTYIITWLLHLRSPVETLLDTKSATSSIFLALLAPDKRQLEKNMWLTTLRMIRICPYIQSRAHIKEESKYGDMIIRLPKNIILSGGSLANHVLGENLFAAIMDEANFRRSADPQIEAYDFYYKLRSRVENRFLRRTGLGFVGLISSEGGEGVFLDRHCNEIRERQAQGKKTDAIICQFAEWEIKAPPDLSGDNFRIDIGDNLRSPKILEEAEEVREGAKVIDVPVEYRDAAEKELVRFLMDIAGTVPGRAHRYFYNVEAVLRAFQLKNPVLSMGDVAELALDTDFEGSDYLDEAALLTKVQGRWKPRIHASAPRFIHIDLAKNDDVAGFAMCHIGDFARGGSPIIHIDFAIAFQASARQPIDYDKILRLVYWLRDSGFNIAGVSYDSYQSQHSMNTLVKEGFTMSGTKGLRSVDRMKDVGRGKVQPEYYSFRSILAEGRIVLPNSVLLRREMLELLNLEEKPDHDKNQTKDLIDAVVGAVANLVESENNDPEMEGLDHLPTFGSTHMTADSVRPKMPVGQENLIPPEYGKGDNVFFDP